MQRVRNDTTTSTWASIQHFDIDGSSFDEGSLQLVYANATTGAKTFSRLSGDSLTMTAHGQVVGSKGQLTTTGTLPAGLSLATDYFVIVVDANTVKFAASLSDAVAGTAVTVTDAGTGTHTFTPTALAGAVAKLQVSNDGTNFDDVANATVTIGSAGSTYWELADQTTGRRLRAATFRVLFTPSAGTVTLSVIPNLYRDR